MRRVLLLVLIAFGCAQVASATAVPTALEPWREWALHGLDRLGCPQPADQAFKPDGGLCAWPGELSIEADAGGARFAVEWQLDAPSWIALPGSRERWPQDVRAGGQPVAVVEHAGQPMAWLETGRHRIEGRLAWTRRPETLRVPGQVARIALSVDGREISAPEREGDQLRLGRGESTAPEADALELQVFRRIADGLPLLLETRIQLHGAGQLREERLPQVLPEGFVPVELESDWPARLEPDGSLRVQVQADSAELILWARAEHLPQEVRRPQVDSPWPAQEIWSYEPDPNLRGSRGAGSIEVDPSRAGVPHDWQGLQAFALAPGDALQIEERGRGEGMAAGNRLQLQRSLWLDHDGGGYSLRDQLIGELREGWRLQANAPLILESASDAERQPLLITQLDAAAPRGVEWRSAALHLVANLRVDQRVQLPLSGWNQRLERVDVDLHLPAGYRLLHAPGAESGARDWLGRWSLLDVFLLAVIGLLAWHALGWIGAGFGIGLLVIGYHEPGLPLLSIGAALAASLLARALDSGRLGIFTLWLRRAVLVLLVLNALPFVIEQARLALHPQLERGSGWPAPPRDEAIPVQMEMASPMSMPAPPPPAPAAPARERYDKYTGLDQIVVTGTRVKRGESFQGYSQSTVMQAGRALPQWQSGHTHSLRYPGPVTSDEPLRLRILSPWAVRSLRVLLIGLLGLLLWQLLGKPRLPTAVLGRTAAGRAAGLLLPLLALGQISAPANAQTPTPLPGPELLQSLRERLTEAPECSPQCAQIARLAISAEGERLQLDLEVHALQRVALPLPQPQGEHGSALRELRLNGQLAPQLLNSQGRWLMPVPAGVHRLQLRLEASADRLSLALPLRPGLISLAGADWQLSGVDEEGVPQAGSVQLLRPRAEAAGAEAEAPAQTFPTYVRVVRRLSLDTQWSLHGEVERVAPVEGDITLEVPLLQGERVGTPGLRVLQGRVGLVLEDGEDSVDWQSQLDRVAQLVLTAPPISEQAEEWRIAVGPMWRAEFSGVPESLDPDAQPDDLHDFVFHPRAGESLTIQLSEPQAAPGSTLALERIEIRTELGRRARDHHLELALRSTVGGEHRFALPAGTELVSVHRDGELLRLTAREGALDLPLQPGNQRFAIQLREDSPMTVFSTSPEIDPGLAAANIRHELKLPAERWVLWTSGPRQGPAVRYWGELLVLMLLALALSRLPHSPLRPWQWLLLVIGFSAVSVYALLLVAAWLFACAWRAQRTPQQLGPWFNPLQIGLLLLSLVAMISLVSAIPLGLLGQPDMRIEGNGSSASQLRWFMDRHEGALPTPSVISLPILVYRGLMLAWALWLAASLVGWLRAALAAWTAGGYWRPWRRAAPPPLPQPDAAPEPSEAK